MYKTIKEKQTLDTTKNNHRITGIWPHVAKDLYSECHYTNVILDLAYTHINLLV